MKDFKQKQKEICKFLKECAKLGIKELEIDGLKFSFQENSGIFEESFEKNQNNFKQGVLIAKKAEETKEEMDEDLKMSQLIVDDYEEFEKLAVQRLSGDH